MYYLKYRPQRLADIDNRQRRILLTQLLSKPKQLPHAYLFAGPKGTGKTSTARILAKVVNCQKNMYAEGSTSGVIDACGKCAVCQQIALGSYLDMHELDGASNRGVDDVRALREEVKFAPLQGRYKLYVIDEAHMLTKEAFNALLKTLEEPPQNVIFILATTEAERIPDTVASRCMKVTFTRATDEELIASLQRIMKGENALIDKAALELIAKAARGSFRDAAKLLELALYTTDQSPEAVRSLLNGHTTGGAGELLALILGQKEKEALAWLARFEQQGGSVKTLIEALLDELHELLLAKNRLKETASFNETQLKGISKSAIAILIKKLIDAYAQTKYSPVEILPLMVAVLS